MIFQELNPAIRYIFCNPSLRQAQEPHSQKDAASIGARADQLEFKFLHPNDELQFFCFRGIGLSNNFVPMGRGAMGYP